MARTADRRELDDTTRWLLAERDLDEHEADISALDARLGKMLWTLVGILISTTTAAILLALNLMVVAR